MRNNVVLLSLSHVCVDFSLMNDFPLQALRHMAEFASILYTNLLPPLLHAMARATVPWEEAISALVTYFKTITVIMKTATLILKQETFLQITFSN